MARPKNILVFHRSFFEISETFIYEQVQTLSKKHNITLLAYQYLNHDKFPVATARHTIKTYTSLVDKVLSKLLQRTLGGSYRMSVFTKSMTRSLLTKGKIDVIHAHFGTNAVAILPIAKSLKIPIVAAFHGIDASPALLQDPEYAQSLPGLFDYATKIVIVSPHMIETLGLARYMNKVELIPYGVDFNRFTRNGNRQSDQDGIIRILHSGRLVGKKGVPDLIRVFARLREIYANIQFTILGDGPEADVCRQLIDEAKLQDTVSMLGAMPHSNILKFMNNSDIFVLNSRTSQAGDMEGTPVSILEAMSMGLPVVSTSHAGIPQVISDGENGLLVPEEDNDQLFSALESLIKGPDLRTRLGNSARQTIIEKFGIELNRQRISQLFD